MFDARFCGLAMQKVMHYLSFASVIALVLSLLWQLQMGDRVLATKIPKTKLKFR